MRNQLTFCNRAENRNSLPGYNNTDIAPQPNCQSKTFKNYSKVEFQVGQSLATSITVILKYKKILYANHCGGGGGWEEKGGGGGVDNFENSLLLIFPTR